MSASVVHGGSFRGPKCWALSALVGLILGVVVGWIWPVEKEGHAWEQGVSEMDGGESHEVHRARVIQQEPDGRRFERFADGRVVEVDEQGKPLGDLTKGDGVGTDKSGKKEGGSHGAGGEIPLALCVPFVLLLLSIALMPFINSRFWHEHYPDFSFVLGAFVLGYYLMTMGSHGREELLHVGMEYYSFIALVGGLFVASGGILIDARMRGRATTNTVLLGVGAVIANIVGTTGASMLLIRPFLRMNEGRVRPIHVVFFIFIVSNCGGCLTPIGDPPLYLGYLKGVPFDWTITHLWPMWLVVNGLLLGLFFVIDSRIPKATPRVEVGKESGQVEVRERVFDPSRRGPIVAGWGAMGLLTLIVGAVFVDPMLKKAGVEAVEGLPIGATIQIVLAFAAYYTAHKHIHRANDFNFGPVKEVGFLFAGIFLTMAPALAYLGAHAASLGLETPTQFFFGTGSLSAFLDNAPTYVSFLQASLGVLHVPMNVDGLSEYVRGVYEVIHADGSRVGFEGQRVLEGISLGAVFFGAMTYIGNGPNFMVKSIVDGWTAGETRIRMPGFFGYMLYAVALLLPVLVVCWMVFIR